MKPENLGTAERYSRHMKVLDKNIKECDDLLQEQYGTITVSKEEMPELFDKTVKGKKEFLENAKAELHKKIDEL